MSFSHPPPRSTSGLKALRLWATHYHIYQADAVPANRDGVELLGARNTPLGVRLTKRDYCLGSVDGIVGNQTWGKALMLGLPAAEDLRPATDRHSDNWPPLPAKLRRITHRERLDRFGSFRCRHRPVPTTHPNLSHLALVTWHFIHS